jgi:hypothetical protein
MQPHWGLEHYAPHFVCWNCRKVYVRECGVFVECLKPREHMQNPPPFAPEKKQTETPPLRAHDQKKQGAQ